MSAIGVAGALFLLLLTPAGLASAPDGAAYIGIAENVANGEGITMPFVPSSAVVSPAKALRFNGAGPLFEYAPGLPVMIGAGTALGLGAYDAARLLSLVCFGLTTALVAWGTLRLSGSYLASLIAAVLLATTGWIVTPFSFVATESLLLPLCLVALMLSARFVAQPSWRLAVGVVVACAAASLTRFEGAATIVSVLVMTLVWYPAALRRRLEVAVGIGLASGLPVLIWSLRGSFGGSTVAWHPPRAVNGIVVTLSTWARGSITVSGRTTTLRYLIIAAVAMGLAATVIALHRKGRGLFEGCAPADRMLVRACWIFGLSYVALLYLTAALVVKAIPFGTKYLIAAYPPLLILAVATAARLLRVAQTRAGRIAGVSVFVVVASVLGFWRVEAARSIWNTKDQYEMIARERGEPVVPGTLFAALRNLPKDVVIFTQAPDYVYVHSRRFAVTLPVERSVWTGELNRDYLAQVASLHDVLCRHEAVVAIPNATGYAGLFARFAHLAVTGSYHDGLTFGPASCG